jgi:hypothetical protein
MASKKLQTVLFCPDSHIPWEDRRAFNLMLKVGKALRPDHLVILGDFADFYSVSFHSRDPSRATRFSDEVRSVNTRLDQMDALGAKYKHFVAGNHEHRAERFLHEKAPELVGLSGLTIPELFHLKDRGWKYTPYRSHTKIGKVWVTHDAGSAGALAASRARDKFQGNVVLGHCHRLVASYSGNAKGESHVGISAGWLGSARGIDYAHKVLVNEWQLAFCVGYMEPSGTMHIQPVPIINYKAVVAGKLFIG